MPVPSTPQDLINLIREKLFNNTSGKIDEPSIREVLEWMVKVLDAKFSLFSPELTEEQYSKWNLMLDYMLRETKGVLTTTSPAPTGASAKGKYLLSGAGTYTNIGGLVATADKLNYAYFDGTTWSLVAADLPQAIVNNYTNNNTYNLDPDKIVPSEALYNDETLAGDIIKRVDQFTGENVNYRETITWHDGSAMTNAKVDGVIYIKKNNKYYKRQFEGAVNVKWFGAKGDGHSDDTTAINNALNLSNKFNKTLFFPAGTYLTTNTLFFHTTQNIVFQSIINTIILRNHSNTGISAENTNYTYHYGVWENINITSSNEFKNTGIGVKILRTSRFIIENLTVTEFSEGLVLDDVMVSNFSNVNFDRNLNKGIVLLRNSNANLFTNLKVLGAAIGTTTGISIDGLDSVGMFTNTFIGGHVEYCNIPVETRNTVSSMVFENVYFENNLNGCILREKTQYIYFKNCFIANKELISDEEFGATSVYVDGLTDNYPIGAGNQNINIKIGNNAIEYRNNIHVEDDNYYFSSNIGSVNSFSLNAGTSSLQSGIGFKNLIHTIDSSHWTGSEFTISGYFGKAPIIKFVGERYTPKDVGFSLKDKNITTQMLAFGKGVLKIKILDNMGFVDVREFKINSKFPQIVSSLNKLTGSESQMLVVSITLEGDISLMCVSASEGDIVKPFIHRGYADLSSFANVDIIDMYNIRVKSSAIPTGYFVNGDEVVNDFSVNKTVYKWLRVDDDWKSILIS